MEEGLLGAVDWTVVGQLLTLFFVCVFVVILVTLGMNWKKVDFADIGSAFGKWLLLAVAALFVVGGGAIAVARLANTEVSRTVPGIQTSEGQQGERGQGG